MNQPQDLLETYQIIIDENPRLTTLKAKYNACANKLNRNKMNPAYLTVAQEEELNQKLYVIKQLILAHE
jgi:heat shock protein HspQ